MSVAASEPQTSASALPRRARFALAAAITWALLHILAGGVVHHGPPVLMASPATGLLGALLVVVLVWGSTAAATLILRPTDSRAPLMAVGLGIALWIAEAGRISGTIDHWLIRQHPLPGPPTGGPYWLLVGDYLLLALAVAGALLIAARLRPPNNSNTNLVSRLRSELGRDAPPAERARGPFALLITVIVALVAMAILTGPAAGETYRGQVYFAVAVGFVGGIFVAQQMTKVQHLIWYLPAPLLVGLLGLIVAGIRPAFLLPADYDHMNIKPAWGAVRALPIEMIAVGLVATTFMLRSPEPDSKPPSTA